MSLEEQVKEMDVKARNLRAAVDTHRVMQNKVGHSENSGRQPGSEVAVKLGEWQDEWMISIHSLFFITGCFPELITTW